MAVGHIVIDVFMLAADAVRRVGQLRHPLLVNGDIHTVEQYRIVHLVGKGAGKGVVGVETQRGVFAVADADADIVQGVGHLAVAVQLIAEHIGHHHHLGVHITADGLERCLVGFDEGIRIPALARQGRVHGKLRCDAAEKIGAGLVGKERNSRIGQGLFNHAGGGGLAVGARDENRRHVLCQRAQQVGTQLQCNAAGKVRAAPAQEPNGEPGQFAG